MATKSARTYTPEERERAVQRGGEIGPSAASKELGIPSGSIAYWQHLKRRRTTVVPAAEGVPSPGEAVVATATGPVEAVEPAVAPAPPAQQSVTAKTGLQAQVARVYTPSQRAQALEWALQYGVTAAAAKFGMSRWSIKEWRRKARRAADGGAQTSPVTDEVGVSTIERDDRILKEWRSHPGLGPSQVRNQMHRQGLKVSVHTVRCVMEAQGYVTPTVRRQEVHDQRYEAVRPNHLWHLDFLHRHIHKQRVYVLLILDDFSRFIVGAALWDGERVAAVQETFLGAVNRYGRPEKAMSDGGSAFYAWKGVSAFTRLLEELEVDQLIARTPSVNGKLEVLNANIQKELFNQETFFDLGEAQRRFAAWVQFYNFRRTHHALGGLLVPADRYFGRADEVLARLEAGQTADGVGEPVMPAERHLDLFRVTSHRGQLEITLLGQRLLLTPAKTS